jgi:hypothetical protein
MREMGVLVGMRPPATIALDLTPQFLLTPR